jgi:chromosome segregation ATPase
MSKGYESLKVIMQKTLQPGKPNPMAIARLKDSDTSNLNKEIEELERIVVDKLGRLRAAVKEGEAVVAGENQHAEQIIESLRTEIAAQEAQLNAARGKELASQRMEQTLTVKIRDLQSDLKKKEEALESRTQEANDLKSKMDVLTKQITQLEMAIQQAKAETGSEAKRAQQLAESSSAKIATLEAELRDSEEIVRAKELALKGLEQNLTAKIQDLESQMKNKEKLLADRDRRVNDLNSQLETLTNGIKGMSSFFRQAEALTAAEAQGISSVAPGEQSKGREEKPATSQFTGPAVASNATDDAREVVPVDFFDRMTHELAEILGPFSSVIVRDHVRALGESTEKFPKTRVAELVTSLSEEIADENVKIRFRKRLGNLLIIGETVSVSSTIEQLPQGRSVPVTTKPLKPRERA